MSVTNGKVKFAAYLQPDTMARVKELYRKSGARTRSDFIEHAIQFYIGRLTADDDKSYLPNAFLSNMRAIADESDNRQSRMLFKVAVELTMVQDLMAAYYNIDPDTMDRLRCSCVKEVSRINGYLKMEDAVDWQRG